MADDSKATDVGVRYAQALFELAKSQGEMSAVEADLKSLKAMRAESADLRTLMSSPAFDAEQKGRGLAAVATAAGFRATTQKFLGLVAANRRAAALPDMISAFERLAAADRGAISAQVTTAYAAHRRANPGPWLPRCERRSARTRKSKPASTPPSWAGSRFASARAFTTPR